MRVTTQEHKRWKSFVHVYDMCGGMNDHVKVDGAEHHGMTTRRRLTRVEGQGGDRLNDELCLADSEELWQHMVNLGKDGMAEEYSKANLWGALVPEQEVAVINGDRSGLARSVHDY